MNLIKKTKKVEKIVVVDETTYNLELNEKQAAMLFILCGQINPSDADKIINGGLETYHGHLNTLVGDIRHGNANGVLIAPIYESLKEFFHYKNFNK